MSDRLYNLLPVVYRLRDAERGEPLRALLAVLEKEYRRLEADIDGLYENWFIETCEEWLVPYIGDLLGVRGLHPVSPRTFSQRAFVANTLAYRRRKGTAAMLEQLARDVTGWPARAVEFFELLAATQHLNHVRIENTRAPDLRRLHFSAPVDSPFDRSAHTAEVRRIAVGRGRYNIPNVGLFLWRLESYPLKRVTARSIGDPADGRYTFNPLGLDAPLFNRPQVETEITHLAEEINVPGRLRRCSSSDPGRVLQVCLDGDWQPASEIALCNLEQWRRPQHRKAAVDVELGRLALRAGLQPAEVLVNYSYGFSGDLGGGPYPRAEAADPEAVFLVTVRPQGAIPTLTAAIALWNLQAAGTSGVITVQGSQTFHESLSIKMPPGSRLVIVAASGERPHLRGGISVEAPEGGTLVVNGLLIEGGFTVLAGSLTGLRLAHSTLVPDGGGLAVEAPNSELVVELERVICGSITLAAGVNELRLRDSITGAVKAPGSACDIQTSTLLGACEARTLEAGNSICTGTVSSLRRQTGCVRFCYLPESSRTPRQFKCVNAPAPAFASLVHGQPEYAQLSPACPASIRTGAEDGAEMGAFNFLKQPQREANLRASLEEYLRVGLEAGIFFVS